MANQWLFKSETYDNCNCAMNCGCQFNLPTTHGYCQTAYIGSVVDGHFNETPLAGLKWAGLWKWPGEIAAGNGKRLIVIDERAEEAQRVALETIISGEACVPLSNIFSVYGSMCENFLDTVFLPIELEADFEHRTATAHIPGILTSRGRPLPLAPQNVARDTLRTSTWPLRAGSGVGPNPRAGALGDDHTPRSPSCRRGPRSTHGCATLRR